MGYHTQRKRRYIATLAWRFIAIAAPLAATQGAIAVMHAFDAWIISDLGEAATAALTPASLLFLVPVFFGQGALAAVNLHVSRDIGAGKTEQAGRHGWSGIYFSIVSGLLSLLLIPVAPLVFEMFGNSSEVIRLEMEYFTVAIFAVPGLHISSAVLNFLIGTNRPWFAFASSLLAITANAILSYIFVNGLLGLPEMGMKGAALGTVGASIIQALILLFVFVNKRNRKDFGTSKPLRGLRNDSEFLGDSITYGIQEAVEILTWSIIMTWLVGVHGDSHLAACTCLIRIIQLSFMPSVGAGIALQTMVSDAIGRKRLDRAELITRIGASMIIGYMTIFGILAYLYRVPLVNLFAPEDSPEAIRIALSLMLIVGIMQFFDALGIAYGDALKGVGDSTWPPVVNFVLCFHLLLGGGLASLYALPHLESKAVWIVDLCYVAVLGVSYYFRWKFGPWRDIRLYTHS